MVYVILNTISFHTAFRSLASDTLSLQYAASRFFMPFCYILCYWHHWSTNWLASNTLLLAEYCFRSEIILQHSVKRAKGSWMRRNPAHSISRIWLTNCNKTRNDWAFALINWQPLVYNVCLLFIWVLCVCTVDWKHKYLQYGDSVGNTQTCNKSSICRVQVQVHCCRVEVRVQFRDWVIST